MSHQLLPPFSIEDATMKIAKYIISVVVILFCFALGSELYQAHLQNFSNRFFYIEIDAEDREAVYGTIIAATEKYGEKVFAVERRDLDAYHSELVVYAAEDMQENLVAQQDITQGDAGSLFSGRTEVLYRPFEEVVSHSNVIRYYFTGSKEAVSFIRQYINSIMATSYLHKETVTGSEWLVYLIWGLSLGFILLMTWLDIQYSKKSDFLRLSMGSSVGAMVAGKILVDILVNGSIALLIYLLLKGKIFVGYKLDFALVAFIAFNIINSCLYTTLFRSDYKEIMYGANINGKLLANTYLLKAMTLILLVISLAFNFTTILKNAEGLKAYKVIDQMTGYSTLSFTPKGAQRAGMESMERREKLKSQMYLEAYAQNKVLLSTSSAALDTPILVVNDLALEKTVQSAEKFTSGADKMFVFYIPQSMADTITDDDIEFAVYSTATNFFGLDEYDFAVQYYSHAEAVHFDLQTVSALPLGFEMCSNPLIVKCNIGGDVIAGLLAEGVNIEFQGQWTNIFFSEEGLEFSKEITDSLEELSYNSVAAQCNQHKAGLLRTVLINSTLSVFLLVVSVLLISVIVKMEYLINSKEIALKKILGYSIFRRNLSIILLNVFSVFIAFITGLILTSMYSLFSIATLCLVCLLVFVIDTILILLNMAVAENKNTAHILKGGSL